LVQKLSDKGVVTTQNVHWDDFTLEDDMEDICGKLSLKTGVDPESIVVSDDESSQSASDKKDTQEDDDDNDSGIIPLPVDDDDELEALLPTPTVAADTLAVDHGTTQSGREKEGSSTRLQRELKKLQIDMSAPPSTRGSRLSTANEPTSPTAVVIERDEPPEAVTAMIRENQSSNFDYVFNISVNSDPGDPSNTREAMEGGDWIHWKEGLFDEYDNFTKRKAWKTVARPKGVKVLRTKNVFKRKPHSITKEICQKVRNVLCLDMSKFQEYTSLNPMQLLLLIKLFGPCLVFLNT
jgi:hypothetical protein